MGGLIAIELTFTLDNIVGLVTIGTGAHMAVNSELLSSAKEKPAFAMVPIPNMVAASGGNGGPQDSASRFDITRSGGIDL